VIDEGIIKFDSIWERAAPLEVPEIAELVAWRQVLHEAGLIGYDAIEEVGFGNLSVRRRGAPGFFITGTATGHVMELEPHHIACVTAVDLAANRVWSAGPAEPSSESLTHAAVFGLSPTIGAVAHGHHLPSWQRLRSLLPTSRDDVAYGTPAMAAELRRLYRDGGFRESGTAVMGGHEAGLIAYGADLEEACRRLAALVE